MTRASTRHHVDFSLNRLFLKSESDAEPLRIGVLVDGDMLPAFGRQILDDISESSFTTVVCYVVNRAAQPASPTGAARWRKRLTGIGTTRWWQQIGYLLYVHFVSRRRQPAPDPERLVSCADLMAENAVLEIMPQQSRHIDRFSTGDVERLRALKLDVILRFGFRILRGEALTVARHGIWSFHHGDSTEYRGGPPYIWELIEGNPRSGVVLQVLREQLDAGPVLARAMFATASSLSAAENAFAPYWGGQHFVIRELNSLHRDRRAHDPVLSSGPAAYRGSRPLYRMPSSGTVARWLARVAARRLVDRALTLRRNAHWRVALRRSETPLYAEPTRGALQEFRWIEGPADAFWADPFLLERAGHTWLFFEELDYRTDKGSLRCGRLSESGELLDVRTVLARPYHLSYPHVFSHEGEVFMLPESEESGTVDLYRARRFPDDWILERTLLNIKTVDSTVFEVDERWWMLTSPMIVDSHAPITYAFTAPSLFGPWTLASNTPVSDDVRHARCGGQVFRHQSELWQPAQDCSGRYGRALVFTKLRVGLHGISKSVATVIEPNWLPRMVGTHSYNRAGPWEAIDGLFLERRLTQELGRGPPMVR